MCRICSKQQETIDNLVCRCSELAKTKYTQIHNRTAAYIHWKICKHYNIKVTDKYYEHEPKTVTENNEATILWDMPIQTDREIKANRPDKIVKDKKQRTFQLIEISVPTERNTSIKTTEKLSKYKDLEIEIERMWGMNTMTIPVIIGALGLVTKGMEKYSNKIPGHISIQETQVCPPWDCSYSEEDFVNQVNYTTLMRTSSSWNELGFISRKAGIERNIYYFF